MALRRLISLFRLTPASQQPFTSTSNPNSSVLLPSHGPRSSYVLLSQPRTTDYQSAVRSPQSAVRSPRQHYNESGIGSRFTRSCEANGDSDSQAGGN
jgi:hypothetical protein